MFQESAKLLNVFRTGVSKNKVSESTCAPGLLVKRQHLGPECARPQCAIEVRLLLKDEHRDVMAADVVDQMGAGSMVEVGEPSTQQ